MNIIKFILLIVFILFIVRKFFKLINHLLTINKTKKNINQNIVKCITCKTYILETQAIYRNNKIYCDKKCFGKNEK